MERILNFGGIVVGKTSMDEYAMGSSTSHCALIPPTLNPWSLSNEQKNLSAGGSSGGSASAVASFCAYGYFYFFSTRLLFCSHIDWILAFEAHLDQIQVVVFDNQLRGMEL